METKFNHGRLHNLKKKTQELSTLCDVDALLICYENYANNPPCYTWPEDRAAYLSLIHKNKKNFFYGNDPGTQIKKRKRDDDRGIGVDTFSNGSSGFVGFGSCNFEGLGRGYLGSFLREIDKKEKAIDERIDYLRGEQGSVVVLSSAGKEQGTCSGYDEKMNYLKRRGLGFGTMIDVSGNERGKFYQNVDRTNYLRTKECGFGISVKDPGRGSGTYSGNDVEMSYWSSDRCESGVSIDSARRETESCCGSDENFNPSNGWFGMLMNAPGKDSGSCYENIWNINCLSQNSSWFGMSKGVHPDDDVSFDSLNTKKKFRFENENNSDDMGWHQNLQSSGFLDSVVQECMMKSRKLDVEKPIDIEEEDTEVEEFVNSVLTCPVEENQDLDLVDFRNFDFSADDGESEDLGASLEELGFNVDEIFDCNWI